MKKHGWKKVLIIVFALVLIFSMAACTEEKDGPVTVESIEFLNKLVGGVSGILGVLGDKEADVKHIEATLAVRIGADGKKAGETTDLEIRIKGNFAKAIDANDIKIEIADMKASNKILFGLYENSGKIYLQESITAGKTQQLSIDGVEALNIRQYLAKLPEMLSVLGSFDIDAILSDSMKGIIGGILDDLMVITFDKNTYTADIQSKNLNEVLTTVLGLVGGNIAPYEDLINIILKPVLGVRLENGVVKFDEGQTFPKIKMNVEMKNDVFNGLTFDYSWPKEGSHGNDTTVYVGLKDINISTTSSPVTSLADFATYKPGALKVQADLNIPGLSDNGFSVKADFYLQPGFGSIEGDAASENSKIKVVLNATNADGSSYPLKAEYKYIDVAGKRVGRIYFDIGGLIAEAGLSYAGNTKFYEDFDIAALLIGVVNPTQKAFEVEGLPEGYTAKAFLKAPMNYQYYVIGNAYTGGNLVWSGFEITKGGAAVGTVQTSFTRDKIGGYYYAVIKLDGEDGLYRVKVTDAQMLAAMKEGAAETTTQKAVAEETVANDGSFAVYDANNTLVANAAKPTRDYMAFTVNGVKIKEVEASKTFYFLYTTKTDNLKDRIETIFGIIKADESVWASIPENFDFDVYSIWQNNPSSFYVYSAAQMKAETDRTTIADYSTSNTIPSKANVGLLLDQAGGAAFGADIVLVLKNEQGVTADSIIAKLGHDEAEAYVTEKLSRYAFGGTTKKLDNNGAELTTDVSMPGKMVSELETNYGGPDFSFNVGALGPLVNLLLEKLGSANGSISIGLNDAASILGMGAYLNTPKLFAAQIRMLLSSEKGSEEFGRLSLTTPYKPFVKTKDAKEIVFTTGGKPFSHGTREAVSVATKSNSIYLEEALFSEIYAKVLGSYTKESLMEQVGVTAGMAATDIGPEGWTKSDVEDCFAKADKTALEKANYYLYKMFTTYSARVAKHDAAYQTYRAEMETKAMKSIKGYIGGGSVAASLAGVNTVYDFLYTESAPLSIKLTYANAGASVITGMPLSFKLEVLRGTTILASATVGLQFIEASTIPTDLIPANYWDGAESVHVTDAVHNKLSKAVALLMQIHAKFAGIDDWTTLIPEKNR